MKSLPLKIFIGLILFILTGYATLEFFGGRILTSMYGDILKPQKLSLSDLDLDLFNGEISLKGIEYLRKSGSRIAEVKKVSFKPRWKQNTIFFQSIHLEDANFSIRVSDIPENLKKKSEPLKIKPRFEKVTVKNVEIKIPGVKGLDGDKFLTFRNINGSMNCQGEILCLKNSFELTGMPIKGSVAIIDGTSDTSEAKKVHARGKIAGVHLSLFNSILSKASPVTAESGKVDLFTEYHLHGSTGDGYLKFFIDNLELKESKDTEAGFLAKMAGKIISDRKIKHFDIRIPVKMDHNKFTVEDVDIKNEVKRIIAGRMLPKGFD